MTYNRITYLLGAGASADAVPVVADISKALNWFKNDLNSKLVPSASDQQAIKVRLFKDIDNLIEKCKSHVSIDTYAKKLLTTNKHRELELLKKIMVLFFSYIQLIKPPDKRYDAFVASIINHKTRMLPDHISIISWNYDFQFEMAYSEYLGNDNIKDVQRTLNVNPPHVINIENKKFGLYKLNGTTVFKTGDDFRHFEETFSNVDRQKLIHDVLALYNYSGSDQVTAMRFAWENENLDTYKDIKRAIADTTELVVIGYTFPFFNREIDQLLLKDLHLQKVYFQTLPEDMDRIVEGFKAVRSIFPDAIVEVNQYAQFHLPTFRARPAFDPVIM
jgi:hypothetical protein